MKWSKEQQHVIDVRGKNVLVAAAAGSGKTSVLVERLVRMISEGSNPYNIDSFLIVTFTNAAAAEMRAKIAKRISEAVDADPDNVHLQKQLTLVQVAQIMTIDSFCLNVVRNYFYMIDLDPSFRIADETELKLMKSDVLAEVLESYYAGEHAKDGGTDEEFLRLVESYGGKRTDKQIEDIVLKLYNTAVSYPWPHEWLDEAAGRFVIGNCDEINDSMFIKDIIIPDIRMLLSDAKKLLEEMSDIINEPEGPQTYLEAWKSDAELTDAICAANNYTEMYEMFAGLKFKALSTKKSEADPDKKAKYQAVRAVFKKIFEDIKKNYFYDSPENIAEDILNTSVPVRKLTEITKSFMESFAKEKAVRNIIDFVDMEHFALKILINREEGINKPTQAALEYRELFNEIIIDEYQDSNLVQETILTSISRQAAGQNNIFMVGDVKQSIYKFRLAKPELFMSKYKTYGGADDAYNEKIDLNANFRSRKRILDSVNAVFYMIMDEQLGKITYDDNASLKQVEGYEDYPDDDCYKTELWLIDQNEITTDDEDAEEYSKAELEAMAVATKIKELTSSGFCVHDRGADGFKKRPVEYRDIVILLRSLTGYADVFGKILKEFGIPVSVQSKTGYFESVEVNTILNLLRIIDNPNQDIAFAGILHSGLVGLNSEELATIKIYGGNRSDKVQRNYYNAARQYCNDGTNDALRSRLSAFFDIYDRLRSIAKRVPVKELLTEIYKETGYMYKVMAMPGGEMRKVNLEMLVKKAEEYAATSYHGLFHFIRYIDRIIKYEIDFGDAAGGGNSVNAVSIMSIHKSKGLEFPVVILAGMGKNFNSSDTKDAIIVHPELGIAPDYIDPDKRIKAPTIIKKAVKRTIELENRAEELRILYVALTRAKEKLIMTGCAKNIEKCMDKWESVTLKKSSGGRNIYTYNALAGSKNYLDYVVKASLMNSEHFKVGILNVKDINRLGEDHFSDKAEYFERMMSGEPVMNIGNDADYAAFTEKLEFNYAYEKEQNIPVKASVSELKHKSMEEDGEESVIEKEKAHIIPEFIKKRNPEADKKYVQEADADITNINKTEIFVNENETNTDNTISISGSDRGTAYHRFLECIHFNKIPLSDNLRNVRSAIAAERGRITESGLMKREECACISEYKLAEFFTSSLGRRMIEADIRGDLFKEQRFMMGIEAGKLFEEYDSNELVIIQGIIDAYFCEGENLILMDYKTDNVKEAKELCVRYHKQLELYAEALYKLNGKKCTERLIYSFKLGKEISLGE